MSRIFLSYRLDDEPGYVARLADGLVDAFGDVVFRDVESIHAGSKWKLEIQKQVNQAEVLIAIIGPRWQSTLAKKDPKADWVRFELNLARMLEIPVIPAQIQGTSFDKGMDLGDLAWLTDLQFLELSDRQGRWANDLDTLIESIVRLTNLQRRARNASSSERQTPPSLKQTTHGKQSPIIQSGGGSVTISFGGKGSE